MCDSPVTLHSGASCPGQATQTKKCDSDCNGENDIFLSLKVQVKSRSNSIQKSLELDLVLTLKSPCLHQDLKNFIESLILSDLSNTIIKGQGIPLYFSLKCDSDCE